MRKKPLSEAQEDNYKKATLRLIAMNKARALPEGEASFRAYWHNFKTDARKRNKTIDISEEEFRKLTSMNCFYCGDPPSQVYKSAGCRGPYIHSGIDRLHNDFGYSAQNCVPCCHTCNIAKHTSSFPDFILKAQKIAEKHKDFCMNSRPKNE